MLEENYRLEANLEAKGYLAFRRKQLLDAATIVVQEKDETIRQQQATIDALETGMEYYRDGRDRDPWR